MSATSATPTTTTAIVTATCTDTAAKARSASRALPVRAFARIAGVLFAALLGLGSPA